MLALLDALKKNVRDFAAREEKLESEFRVQTAAGLRDFADRNQAQEAAAMAQDLDAAMALKNEKDQCQLRFERRKAWINSAHAAVSRRVMNQIGEQDTQWKDRTQQGVQQAEIRRDEELANASATFERFQQQLAEAGDGLNQLDTAARGAFGGYGKFRRLLAHDGPGRSQIWRRTKMFFSSNCKNFRKKFPATWRGSENCRCRKFSNFCPSG